MNYQAFIALSLLAIFLTVTYLLGIETFQFYLAQKS